MDESRRKILIVDDNPLDIRVLGEVLRDDYDVVVATDGPRALEIAAAEDGAPDLILLDIVMQGMDGYAVLRRLKDDPRMREIPVMFISAMGEEDHELRGLELGAVDYIRKPFCAPVVRARINTQLELKAMLWRERRQREQLDAVIRCAMDAIIHINAQGTVQLFNPAAEKIFGFSSAEIIGRNISLLMPEAECAQHQQYLARYVETGVPHSEGGEREVTAIRKDGSSFPAAISISAMHFGEEVHFIGVVRDISERRRTEEQIRKLAYFDALTGLPNRVLFMDRMEQALARAHRDETGFSLLFLDLDGFKAVNDNLGHKAGDQVLRLVAERLRGCVREVDTTARMGGDEFTIILPGVTRRGQASAVVEKICAAIEEPMMVGDGEARCSCQIGASIGVALHPEDGVDLESLIRSADEGMYSVKRSRK